MLQDRRFDLLICGGGIYGAWTAYDAALRGLRVAIVEQADWASATSSASSKLIHGGLRYLESFDFRLVKKALAERRRLLKNAPHRVWPLRFGVPVYANGRLGMTQLKAGLVMYDLLAGWSGAELLHRRFDRRAFAQHFPLLQTAGLNGGYTYADAQTDDARLVLELIDGAMQAGAVCVNYCKLSELLEADGTACGATIQDQLSSHCVQVSASQIVYATGQWLTTSGLSQDCRLTKGIHLVMPQALGDEALLLTGPADGRVFFMIPWYGVTLVGTTDTDYRGNIDNVTVEPADVEYLLSAANHYLKKDWTATDIIGSYAGLRVLKRGEHTAAAGPSAVSRDWTLKTSGNGVHYSIGGKITSAREDAASIVDTVCAQLGSTVPCATRDKYFPWAPQQDYASWLSTAGAQGARLGIDRESMQWLLRRHGKRVNEIFRSIETDAALAARILPALPFIRADLIYSARHEMVVHLSDLLRRRMPLSILARLTESDVRNIAEIAAPALDWDDAAVHREVAACRL